MSCPRLQAPGHLNGLIVRACTDGEDRIPGRPSAFACGHRFEPSRPVGSLRGSRGQGRGSVVQAFRLLRGRVRPSGMCNRRDHLSPPTGESPVDRAAKASSSGRSTACSRHDRRRRRPLRRPHGRRHAEAALADEAGRRHREGRKEPPRQDRSRRHGRRLHRPLLKGPTAAGLFQRPGRGAEGRRRLRQGQRQARHPWRRDG